MSNPSPTPSTPAPVIAKRHVSKNLTKGKLFIKATFNNTIATVTDLEGQVMFLGSAGSAGFKGSRKSTPYAATTTIEKVLNDAKRSGLNQVEVYIKGPGPGRDAVLRVLRSMDIKINLIADVTPIPHNGCRPKKRRRV
jgi:small subunit ribosomal protein S11